ncbi:MAG TPA: GGDEF domain-containing protein [Acidobacteria bacterium]|nr:GGDEF domain-containing protein [Acidobacteriota bacterium]
MTSKAAQSGKRECSIPHSVANSSTGGWISATEGVCAPVSGELLGVLARCLALEQLEETVIEALRSRIPERTILVNLASPAAEPRRMASPGRPIRPWPARRRVPPLLAVPIQDQEEVLGWIAVVDGNHYSEESTKIARAALREVAAAAGIPTRNAHVHGEALSLALRDPLTGLFNRRAFEAFIERESQGAQRSGRSLTLIMIDLDEFKPVNDRFGHPAGDALLKGVAEVLLSNLRRSDIVARIGGDEFAVLLPETTLDAGVKLARRLRNALASAQIEGGAKDVRLRTRGSFGVAELGLSGGCASGLVEAADRALYSAKRRGGHRVHRGQGRRHLDPTLEAQPTRKPSSQESRP